MLGYIMGPNVLLIINCTVKYVRAYLKKPKPYKIVLVFTNVEGQSLLKATLSH